MRHENVVLLVVSIRKNQMKHEPVSKWKQVNNVSRYRTCTLNLTSNTTSITRMGTGTKDHATAV